MSDDEVHTFCRTGTLLGIGISVGVVVGIAVGSAVALRVGSAAMRTMRGLVERITGRNNHVNFELLLQ
jgi:hypothetical protein